ncbi:hypothetical protein B0H10DRAFT_2008718 [Mycena sp. CBHHK59/15]|nr:hypothetical protein B0H10DRAFT_2008718 [Mycena sp. CBHHK59/15]
MSSTTSTKLGDDFLRIAKLEVTGKNWAVDARGFAEHLDANAAPPVDPNLAIRMAATTAGTAAPQHKGYWMWSGRKN